MNVAPKGKVYVYTSGQATKLVGIYQAKAINYDYDQHVLDTYIRSNSHKSRQEYVDVHVKNNGNLKENLYVNYNENYFKPVRWQLEMKGTQPILAYVTKTLNGEYIHILEKPTEQEISSIPNRITLDILVNGKPKRLRITFNHAFEFFNQHFDYRSKVKIILDMPNDKNFAVYFQQGEKLVEFEDIRVQELDR